MYHTFIFLSSLFTIIPQILSLSSLEIPYTFFSNAAIMIPIGIGTPPKGIPQQSFQIQLDTSSNDFWLREYNDNPHSSTFDEGYISRISSTYLPINTSETCKLNYAHGSIEGKEMQETITIDSISLQNQTLILANVSSLPREIDGILGLKYNPSAFLSILHSKALINHKLFAMNPHKQIIHIGSFPKEIISDNSMQHFSYCRVMSKIGSTRNKSWKCLMTSIHPGNDLDYNYLQTTTPIEISFGTKNVLVSYHLLNQFYFGYLPQEFRSKCKIDTTRKIFSIECDKTIDINVLDDVIIEFDYMTLNVPKEELFTTRGTQYSFLFKTNDKYDEWVIGLPLLKYFTTVFDAEKNVIVFHSEKYVINRYDKKNDDVLNYYRSFDFTDNNKTNWMIVIYEIIAFLCIGGVVLNAISKYKLRFSI